MIRTTFAEIDLNSIRHNLATLKYRLGDKTKLCAVVKANAYGHGAVPVAWAAATAGADYLAVAFTQEGVELREAGLNIPILILGTLDPDSLSEVVRYDMDQAVYTAEQLRLIDKEATAQHKKARVQIKIDTGMCRIGVAPGDCEVLAKAILKCKNVEITGAFSHFATADEEDKTFSHKQFTQFKKAVRLLEKAGVKIPLKHICNSAGGEELPEYRLDMVRQGITLYGLLPGDYRDEYAYLQPAMRIYTKIVYVKEVPKGATIGYGRTFTAPKKMKVATVPVGYADGYPRSLSNKGYMMVRDCKVPVIGRVCMDQLMLDVSSLPDVAVGDEVLVAGGKDLPMEQIAQWANTVNYEIICGINSKRVSRIYKGF